MVVVVAVVIVVAVVVPTPNTCYREGDSVVKMGKNASYVVFRRLLIKH